MQYRQYGAAGPMISRLGFGVMRLQTRKYAGRQVVNYTKSTALMRSAMEGGVNLFDSHHNYHGGQSEIAIGKALKGWRGQRIYVQTKTPWYRNEPTKYFEKLLDEAMEKLGVDSIDYLLHHAMSMDMWKKRGSKFIRFTDRAMKRGLIKHRGFSSHDTPENIKEFVDTGEFSVMLVSYNWLNPQVRDAIAYAADAGMGVTVMNPVGGGALAASTPQILRLLRGAGSSAEIALRYVLATPGVAGALSGMNTDEQLEENVAIASRKTQMTAKQSAAMRKRLRKIKKAAAQFCTLCGYCMPCEHGVDIPGNFNLFNRVKFFGQEQWARHVYAGLERHRDGDRSARACQQCGDCLPKCPNNVPIIDQLQQVAAMLSDPSRGRKA